MLRTRPPIIIDIEASGFGAESYPIEIGVVLGDGAKYCSLIEPRPEWTHWDPAAETVIINSGDGLKTYGRSMTVADRLNDDRVLLAKWIRRLTNWNGRQAPVTLWNEKIVPLIANKLEAQKTPVVRFVDQQHRILAQVSIAE